VLIKKIEAFQGKNIYSHKPIIKLTIDFGELYKRPTKDLNGFNINLLKLFPGFKKHYCSTGHEGGFIVRLNEGTYIGHVIEHMILELQSLLGDEVFYGKTRIISEPALYYIVYEYKNLLFGIECGKVAIKIASMLINNEEVSFDQMLKDLSKIKIECELGPSSKAIYDEALKRKIPVSRVGTESLLRLGYGKYSRLIEASLSDAPSCIEVDIAGNKSLTKQVLKKMKLPIAYGDISYTEEMAVDLANSIGYPVVIKPYNANQGKGVTLGIKDDYQVRYAFAEAMKYSKAVLVENYIKGKDFRILVVGEKVVAVAERRPPSVNGDGIHSIKELIAIENRNSLRGDDHEKPLTKIKLDSIAIQVLKRNGLDENYIPQKYEGVLLRDNCNLSTGGTARECTEELHPFNANLAVKAAKVLGLDIAGIDLIAEDISVPLKNSNGAIIEVNAAPGLRMHLYPTEGNPINVAADILDLMYPIDKPCSIPIIAITGTNGKTTTTRLIRHTLTLAGKKVGMTSTSGLYIGSDCILKGDNTGPVSARLVLENKEVETAVLETARGGIVRRGLGYDLADVGIILNISEDHLGLDGLDSLKDLSFVKALVIEAVKPEGYAVLNADDEMLDYFLSRTVSKVILFSKEYKNPIIIEHMKKGERAIFTENNTIYIFDGIRKKALIKIDEIPITYGGKVECNIENAMAAAAALFAINTTYDLIKLGLKTFMPDALLNPGRFNIFDMGEFKVMLDYGHNPAGYKAVIKFLQKMEADRLVGIIGVPGDRLDRNIQEVGQMCSKVFSKIYLKEDDDLRGRVQGEVIGILFDSLIKNGTAEESIEVVYSEIMALEKAILDAQPGDLIVMLYQEFEPAIALINKLMEELRTSLNFAKEAIEDAAILGIAEI
jgi:cyanophycin synthetase